MKMNEEKLDVDLIQVSVSELENQLNYFKDLLTADELEKSQRFHFAADCKRFALARGKLRKELGKRLRKSPQDIQFVQNRYGKPSVKQSNIEFNISHSGDKILLGFADRPVGVDIEQIRDGLDELSLAKRFFADEEYSYLSLLPDQQVTDAFFKIWVCKEAVIKALGTGLSCDLRSFVVDVSQQCARLKFHEKRENIMLQFVETAADYFAACALNLDNS